MFKLVLEKAEEPEMYGCENWTVKKAERRRIDAFELWCWRRLLSQGIFLTQESNQGLLHWQVNSLTLCHLGPQHPLQGDFLGGADGKESACNAWDPG